MNLIRNSQATFCLLMPFYIGDCVSGFQKSLDSVNGCDFDKIYIVIDGPITMEQKIFIDSLEKNPLFYVIRLKKNIGLSLIEKGHWTLSLKVSVELPDGSARQGELSALPFK